MTKHRQIFWQDNLSRAIQLQKKELNREFFNALCIYKFPCKFKLKYVKTVPLQKGLNKDFNQPNWQLQISLMIGTYIF